jgi:NADH-quinone oxidoreductase subunit H
LSETTFTLLNIAVMVVVMWAIPLNLIPFFIWLERKGSAIIQDRIGPNRAEILGFRLFGLIHNFADVLKLLFKENITPAGAHRFYYLLAPFWSMTLSLLPLLLIPLAAPFTLGERRVVFQAADLNMGLLFILAITSLGVFGVILAGWASNNKYSLMGGLRSSAQMISYELSMGLSVVGLLMVFKSVRVGDIVQAQAGAWGILLQPVGFLLFLTAAFAETNRNPFDLAEGESELVAGYHIEYSSVKFALFFMAEYANMVGASFLLATLFLGGYQVPFATTEVLQANPGAVLAVLLLLGACAGALGGWILRKRAKQQETLHQGVKRLEPYLLSWIGFAKAVAALALLAAFWAGLFSLPPWAPPVLAALLQVTCLLLKVLFFCWLFVWVRWTLPRFRYDQLMDLGWKVMLPIAMVNLLLTGIGLLVFND